MNKQTMIGRGRRVHYDAETSAREVFRAQGVWLEQEFGNTPSGLWYAFEDDYLDWLVNNEPGRFDNYTTAYMIDASECNLLILDTRDKVFEFSREYRYMPAPGEDVDFDYWVKELEGDEVFFIDWVRVTEEFDGIELNPYFFDIEMTNEFLWYCTKDIASGCIWALDKITVTKLGE